MAQKLILDVDTGGDDAVAILIAGHHSKAQLVAVTVTHGNAPLQKTLDNTLRVIQAGKLEHVPVFCGAEFPLIGSFAPTVSAQRITLPLPPASIEIQAQRAAEFLIEYYMGQDSTDTIYMPLGPQTNLALALRLEPRLSSRIPRIVTMGGAYIEGNTTPSAEFNILADPEAAWIVFNSGIPITMIGLEVTAQALVKPADVEHIRSLGSHWAMAAANIMQEDVRWYKDNMNLEGGQIYDAVAVAAAIEPTVMDTKAMHVDIELKGELTRGRTVADISGYHHLKPNVDVGIRVNRQRFIEIMTDGLR